jgi:hypothetical protein
LSSDGIAAARFAGYRPHTSRITAAKKLAMRFLRDAFP